MSHPAITCHVNDPLNVAAQRMWDHNCGALAIVNDEGKLTGMLTDRDICMAALTHNRPLDQLLVNGAMASHVFYATADQPLAEVEHMMTAHHVRRVPVVDRAGAPIGVISIVDMAHAVS